MKLTITMQHVVTFLIVFSFLTTQERARTASSADGITILGTTYSHRLKALYRRVSSAYQKPITVEPISGHIDDSIDTHRDDAIVIRLHPGAREDVLAHELMHAVLRNEGYPRIFAINSNPLSISLRNLLDAFLDHLIINSRLLQIGYDARKGFLAQADPYDRPNGIVAKTMEQYPFARPNEKAVTLIAALSELMKFKHYIGATGAEEYFVRKLPAAEPYWRRIDRTIISNLHHSTPQDMWKVGAEFFATADAICHDTGASYQASDLLGMSPVSLTESEMNNPASQLFSETQTQEQQGLLLRTFLKRGHVLVGVLVVPPNTPVSPGINSKDIVLSVREFANARRIGIHVIR